MNLESKVPGGPVQQKWDRHRFEMKLVNPANKRKFRVIVVGTGLAGGSAAAICTGRKWKTCRTHSSPASTCSR